MANSKTNTWLLNNKHLAIIIIPYSRKDGYIIFYEKDKGFIKVDGKLFHRLVNTANAICYFSDEQLEEASEYVKYLYINNRKDMITVTEYSNKINVSFCDGRLKTEINIDLAIFIDEEFLNETEDLERQDILSENQKDINGFVDKVVEANKQSNTELDVGLFRTLIKNIF